MQVKLYELQSGTWNQIGSDINGENQTDVTAKWHGLSLNGDGPRVAIGAHNNDNFLPNSGQVRIFDSSGITISQTGDTDGSDLLTSEAGTSSSFTVVLDAEPTGTVAISGLNSAEGSLSADSLSFSPSNWDTPQTITITDATVAASALNTLDGKTTVAIDAASIDELTCATADLNTAYTAFDAGTITGLSNEDASLSDSTLAASVLNILDANTSGTIDAACSMNSLARSLISTQASTQKSSAIWRVKPPLSFIV